MKKFTLKILFASIITLIGLIGSTDIKTINAKTSTLKAETIISLSDYSNKSIDNINIKIEFTTNVNLDGENNALLIALASSDNTLLSDQRFVAQSTSSGIYDEDDTVLVFERVPSTIGTKTKNGGYYTYSIETIDFTVIDNTKNISKLVVIGQKGKEIIADLTITEVKYSVTFEGHPTVLYSYRDIIEGPGTSTTTYDLNNHYEWNKWVGDDSSLFNYGTTRATKDIVYTKSISKTEAHSWVSYDEVKATRNSNGTKAHEVCSICGAIRLNSESTSLSTEADLVTTHTCVYDVTFDWMNAVNPGDIPVITYTCNDSDCAYSYVVPQGSVTVTEKAGSRVDATYEKDGSVIFIASTTYEGYVASEEKTYILPMSSHVMTYHPPVAATCTTDGTIGY